MRLYRYIGIYGDIFKSIRKTKFEYDISRAFYGTLFELLTTEQYKQIVMDKHTQTTYLLCYQQ